MQAGWDHVERRARLVDVFRGRYGAAPSLLARAPGRVELMGSHTDYNLGHVLTLPVHLDTWIAARPRADRTVRAWTMDLEEATEFSLDRIVPGPVWTNYLRGVAVVCAAEGLPLCGLDLVIHTTIPLGGGLSSSAALECATAAAFQAAGGWTLAPVQMAQLCQRAENEFVGVRCGILDQYSACVSGEGGALLLDCRDVTSRPVGIAAGLQVVVCDTRSTRELGGSEYGLRRAQCEEGAAQLGVRALREVTRDEFERQASRMRPVVARRCRFILDEDARVAPFAEAVSAGDRATIGRLAAASFRGANDLFEIGAPSMTAMMRAIEQSPGQIGARQSGAGFGGCLMAVVEASHVEAFVSSVRERYLGATGLLPEIYAVGPGLAAGADLSSGPSAGWPA
jgi:galactokinase